MYREIRNLAKQGYSLNEVKAHLRVGDMKIREVLEKNGYETYSKMRDELKEEWKEKNSWRIMCLVEQGDTMKQIREKTGFNTTEVNKILNYLGYESYMEARDDLYYFRLGFKMKDEIVQDRAHLMRKYNVYRPAVERVAKMHNEKDFNEFFRKYLE